MFISDRLKDWITVVKELLYACCVTFLPVYIVCMFACISIHTKCNWPWLYGVCEAHYDTMQKKVSLI